MTDTTITAGAIIPAIERKVRLAATPERVWRSITDPQELSRWFPDRAELDVRVGGAGRFDWTAHGTCVLRVEAVEAPAYLAWSWANQADPPLDEANSTLVEWWVAPHEEGGTLLTVRESGFKRPEQRSDNDLGWTSELAELVELLAAQAA